MSRRFSRTPLGIVLTPLALIIEGPPPESFTPANVSGYLYLGIIGTPVAYTLSFRGIHLVPASTTAFLGLLSPLVATLCGWIVLPHLGLSRAEVAETVFTAFTSRKTPSRSQAAWSCAGSPN